MSHVSSTGGEYEGVPAAIVESVRARMGFKLFRGLLVMLYHQVQLGILWRWECETVGRWKDGVSGRVVEGKGGGSGRVVERKGGEVECEWVRWMETLV